MIESTEHQRLLTVECQIASEFARDRIALALYEVLVEGMEFGPVSCPKPRTGMDPWRHGGPAAEATDGALRSSPGA